MVEGVELIVVVDKIVVLLTVVEGLVVVESVVVERLEFVVVADGVVFVVFG